MSRKKKTKTKETKEMKQNQIAAELGISKSYLSMILSGQRKCPEKLHGALSMFTNVHNTKLNGAWKAGTPPTELLPQNRIYFSPSSLSLSKGVLACQKWPTPTKLLDSELTSNSML